MLRERRSFYISVNVTGENVTDPGFIDLAVRQMTRESVHPEQVALRLTKRTTEARGHLLAGMNRLCELSLQIYVNDFGTDYSNLVYLASLPADAIKIDKAFVQSIGDSNVIKLISDKLCSMAEYLEIDVVVEEIETQAQADHVLHCSPEAPSQGWYFSEALPLEVLLGYHRNQPTGHWGEPFVGASRCASIGRLYRTRSGWPHSGSHGSAGNGRDHRRSPCTHFPSPWATDPPMPCRYGAT